MQAFEVGQSVIWKWMGNEIYGVVVEAHFAPVIKEIKGKMIKRNGSVEKPAYLVKSEAGNFALKLHTELIKNDKKDISLNDDV